MTARRSGDESGGRRTVRPAFCRVPNFPQTRPGDPTMSFGIYLAGFAILLIGVLWGMSIAGVPSIWIGITALILLGIGIISGVSRTRSKDPPEA
jgi:hypothetical protein